MLLKALPFIAVAVSLLFTLFALGMMAFGCANMPPAKITIMKWLATGTTAVCLAGVTAAVLTFIAGRYGLAATLGILPAAFVVVLFIVLVKISF